MPQPGAPTDALTAPDRAPTGGLSGHDWNVDWRAAWNDWNVDWRAAWHDGWMPQRRFVLASASPARLRLLQAAGIEPEVIISNVPEDDVDPRDPARMVATLARRKAEAVGAGCRQGELVLGCDSTLDVDGQAYGKPASAHEAVQRWLQHRGRSATLLTGHHLIDTATGRHASGVAATEVHFGTPTDEEIEAYVATGEPLAVAGAFTLDGRSAAFINGVNGDPSNVIGCSLALVRTLTRELGVEWTSLWA